MKLSILHRTTYRYAQPVTFQPHRLMVTPRSGHDLRTLSASLTTSPQATLDWGQDVFGNIVSTATFAEPARELVITSEVTVDQTATPYPVFGIAPSAHSYPFNYTAEDRTDLGAMLLADIEPDQRVSKWASGFVMGRSTDTLALLKDINAGVLSEVAYRTRDEEGTQTARETLDLASGSCRDIAALFIDTVRQLGFGARAVSGYLFDPDAAPDDPGSTHAWTEVYLPQAGWIAFDPTHRRVGEACLIPVAIARNNAQIMPVIGGFVGKTDDFEGMSVDVRVTRAV